MGVLAKEIRSLEKLIKDLDKAIDDLVVVLPEYQCLTSIPEIGPVYAAVYSLKLALSIAFQMKANWLNMPVYIGDRTNQVTLSMKILLWPNEAIVISVII